MPTVPSPNRYDGRVAPIRLIVLHTMETDEASNIAENVAAYFSRTSTRASAHLCVDNDSTVRCVDDQDTAWAAPGANADGLQIEMAGRAGQNASQWADTYSKALIERSAREVAAWCNRWGIPARYLTDAQLADGLTRGIVTHAQVSRVFKRSDHTDPGKNFPAQSFLARVQTILTPIPKPPAKAPTRPASVTVPPFPGTVRRGSRGPAVRAVQARLKARGWLVTVDGDFGPATQAVVRAFQLEKLGRRAVDGIAGPNTWRALWTSRITN
jgi:N-acetyl-anhydromuramyl-L-alanine amidase AmpD